MEMNRDELLKEFEKHLKKVFNPIGLAFVKGTEDIYRDQLWKIFDEAYSNGEIDVMPEDIKVSFDEYTRVLQCDIEWPVKNQIQLPFSYSPETE